MKKTLMCMLFTMGMLGACTGQKTPPEGVSTPSQSATEAGRKKPATPKPLHEPLFDGYRPTFKYALRSDKAGTGKDGKPIRRVVLEYIGTDETKLMAILDRDLKKVGYSAKPWRNAEGRSSTHYVKKSAPRVGVTITPATESLPTRAAGADGFVKFIWVTEAH